jgi:hypothetical protein
VFGMVVALYTIKQFITYAFREDVMKKLLLSLVVLTALVSCGKDNKVSSSGYGSSAITISDSSGNASALGTYINASETYFGNGYASNYGTWNQTIAALPYYSYKYVTTTYSSGNSNCTVKWSIFYVCSSSSLGSGVSLSRSVLVSSVDIATKRAELAAIVNSAYTYNGVASIQVSQQSSGVIYYIQSTSGVKYAIDTRIPLQANPSAIQQANGQIEYFYGLYQ